MRKQASHDVEVPISSLIDVVFLLIIFFVVTATIEKAIVDESIRLAHASNSKPVAEEDPRSIIVNMNKSGAINIAMQPCSLRQLQNILTATSQKHGNSVPVVIRADKETRYKQIDKVMEVIGKAGLYKIKISAVTTAN